MKTIDDYKRQKESLEKEKAILDSKIEEKTGNIKLIEEKIKEMYSIDEVTEDFVKEQIAVLSKEIQELSKEVDGEEND